MLIHGLFHTHGMKNHQASEGVEYDMNNLIIEPKGCVQNRKVANVTAR